MLIFQGVYQQLILVGDNNPQNNFIFSSPLEVQLKLVFFPIPPDDPINKISEEEPPSTLGLDKNLQSLDFSSYSKTIGDSQVVYASYKPPRKFKQTTRPYLLVYVRCTKPKPS